MKLKTAIAVLVMMSGAAWGQTQTVVQSTKAQVKAMPATKASGSAVPAASQKQPAKSPFSQMKVKPAPVVIKKAPASKPAVKKAAVPAKPPASKPATAQPVSVENQAKPAEAKSEKPMAINLTGRRDPFISPVISQTAVGSGCSSGKRCLAVGAINLKGIVKAESGMIAVVVNALDKAYFLRENDPVFNGYVVKITGDSVVFKETVQDKLGKPFTREVTKKISAPSV